MKTQCPHCNMFFDVDDDCIGRTAKCMTCGRNFTVSDFNDIVPIDEKEVVSKRIISIPPIGIIAVVLFFVIVGAIFLGLYSYDAFKKHQVQKEYEKAMRMKCIIDQKNFFDELNVYDILWEKNIIKRQDAQEKLFETLKNNPGCIAGQWEYWEMDISKVKKPEDIWDAPLLWCPYHQNITLIGGNVSGFGYSTPAKFKNRVEEEKKKYSVLL